jgi:hypothetical protein
MVSDLYLRSIVAKVKGFAEEAKLNRLRKKIAARKEKPLTYYQLVENSLGYDARHHLIAYAFIKGIPYKKVEGKCTLAPDVKKLVAIVKDNRHFIQHHPSGNTFWQYAAFMEDEKITALITTWLADTTYVPPAQPVRAKRTPEEIAAMRALPGRCAML